MVRYFSRIERLIENANEYKGKNSNSYISQKEQELLRVKNRTIKEMGQDINDFGFNTAIARSMELLNKINEYMRENDKVNESLLLETVETYVKLIAPLAPHFSEELWEKLGHTESVHKEEWPIVNEKDLNGGTKEIPVQVNGKLKATITVDADITPEEMLNEIKNSKQVKDIYEKYTVKTEIYVPGKIYNLVVEVKK